VKPKNFVATGLALTWYRRDKAEGSDKTVEVVAILVFDTKIVDD
jgi:hypothetical protein